jgi:hypothetical protein
MSNLSSPNRPGGNENIQLIKLQRKMTGLRKVFKSAFALPIYKRDDDTDIVPLTNANVTSTGSSTSSTLGNPENLKNNSTWLLEDNVPGSWSASLAFTFNPSVLRLRNAVQDGRGTKIWRFSTLPDGGILNLTHTDGVTGDRGFCDARCPLPEGNQTEQVFYFVNVVPMNAFRIDISDWFGSGGGLDGIQLETEITSLYNRESSSSRATSTSSAPGSTSTSPAPTDTSSVSPSRGMSGGAIAGIAVGALAAIGIILVVVLLTLQRVKRKRNETFSEEYHPPGGRHELDNDVERKEHEYEVDNTEISEMAEAPTEAGSHAVYEMHGESVPAQLDVAEARTPGG